MRGEVVVERVSVNLGRRHPPATGNPCHLLRVAGVVHDRHAALADRVEISVATCLFTKRKTGCKRIASRRQRGFLMTLLKWSQVQSEGVMHMNTISKKNRT